VLCQPDASDNGIASQTVHDPAQASTNGSAIAQRRANAPPTEQRDRSNTGVSVTSGAVRFDLGSANIEEVEDIVDEEEAADTQHEAPLTGDVVVDAGAGAGPGAAMDAATQPPGRGRDPRGNMLPTPENSGRRPGRPGAFDPDGNEVHREPIEESEVGTVWTVDVQPVKVTPVSFIKSIGNPVASVTQGYGQLLGPGYKHQKPWPVTEADKWISPVEYMGKRGGGAAPQPSFERALKRPRGAGAPAPF
jgi:hypothetical protein